MAVFSTPFTIPGNYSYDSGKIEVSGGLAKLLEVSSLLSGLQAYWRMEEASWNATPGEVIDSSSSGLHGQAINGANTSATGRLGRCGQFDGSNDQIIIPDNAFAIGDFTISVWVKTSSTGYRVVFASSLDNVWNYPLWILRMDTSQQAQFVLATSVGNTINISSSSAINDNVWHLIVAWREGDVGYIQVDNGIIVNAAFNGSLSNAVENRIGERYGGSSTAWSDSLDEIAIWNRVLTSLERTDLYNNGSGKIIQEEYASDEPTIYKTVGDNDSISSFDAFAITEGIVDGSLRFQLSSDGATWYYWDGGVWSVAGPTNYNIAATVNTNIGAFPTAPDKIYVKTFFISDGTQRVEIDNIDINYTSNLVPSVNSGTNKSCKDNQTIKPFSDCSFSDPDGCYSDDTEILTENGWELLKNIVENKKRIKIATLNPNNHELEYNYPAKYFEYDYNGKMLHIKGQSIDCLVTLNHNVYLRKQFKDEWQFIKAKDINFGTIEYKKNCKWKGIEKEYFILPSITHDIKNKYANFSKTIIEKRIKMDDWLSFLGIWLAEGSVYYAERLRTKSNRILKNGKNTSLRKEYVVAIAQNNNKKREIIENWVKNIGFNCGVNGSDHSRNIVFCNKQLVKYLYPLRGVKNKYIPNEFKQLSKRQLRLLFDAMMLGGGHIGKNSFYSTSSKQLAYDFEEIALKLGFATNVSIQKGNYRIRLNKSQLTPEIRKKSEQIDYEGRVYCLEVPNHLMYVRRNGKAIWSGNSIDFVRYKVDGEIDIWTSIPIGGYATLLEAVQDFSYTFNNLGILIVKLQVEDNSSGISEDSLTVTVSKYTKTVSILDAQSGLHLVDVTFDPDDGTGPVSQNSPFSWSWEYGTFNAVLSKANYYSKIELVSVTDESDLNLTLSLTTFINRCEASLGLITESDTLVICAWLSQNGNINDSPTSCTIAFKDSTGTTVYSGSSSSPDVDGVFLFSNSPSNLSNEGVYRIHIDIVADSITYTSVLAVDKIQRDRFSLDGKVYIDTVNGFSGIVYPKGTFNKPVNNWVEAKIIADANLIKRFVIRGDLTFVASDDVGGYEFSGDTSAYNTLTFNGGNTTDAVFRHVTLQGSLNGKVYITDGSRIKMLSGFEGEIYDSCLTATLILAGTGAPLISKCVSGIPGSGSPVIDMGGSGRGLNLRAYSGGIKLTNKTGSESVTLEFIAGQWKLDSTVINGYITIRGVVKKGLDESGSGCIIDTTAAVMNPWAALIAENISLGSFGEIMNLLRAEAIGRMELDPSNNILTLYDLDGTTILKTFDLTSTIRTLPSYIGRDPQ